MDRELEKSDGPNCQRVKLWGVSCPSASQRTICERWKRKLRPRNRVSRSGYGARFMPQSDPLSVKLGHYQDS